MSNEYTNHTGTFGGKPSELAKVIKLMGKGFVSDDKSRAPLLTIDVCRVDDDRIDLTATNGHILCSVTVRDADFRAAYMMMFGAAPCEIECGTEKTYGSERPISYSMTSGGILTRRGAGDYPYWRNVIPHETKTPEYYAAFDVAKLDYIQRVFAVMIGSSRSNVMCYLDGTSSVSAHVVSGPVSEYCTLLIMPLRRVVK